MKKTFYFIHPGDDSKHDQMITDITRKSLERATGNTYPTIESLDQGIKHTALYTDKLKKWKKVISKMDIIHQTYVVLYILHYHHVLNSDGNPTDKNIETFLSDKKFQKSRDMIWKCVADDGETPRNTRVSFDRKIDIVDVSDVEGKDVDELIKSI